MQTAKQLVGVLAEVFGDAIVRTSKPRTEPPNCFEMQVLKRRASKYAKDEAARLKHPATNPDHVEADILMRVAISDSENEMTAAQRDELLKLIMDESGMTALKEQRLRLAQRRVG